MRQTAQRGLSLPEVLIALLVFSVIASTSVYALRLGVDARDQLSAADADLKDLQLARMLIKEDMAQIVLRPVRDEFGETLAAPFWGGRRIERGAASRDETILLSFVRAGWINPDARAPRSALQYVEYIQKGDQLIRRARAYLDDAKNAQQIERVLFSDLGGMSIEYLNGEFRGELQWASEWPLSVGAQGAGHPVAIALHIQRQRQGALRQLFWIGEVG